MNLSWAWGQTGLMLFVAAVGVLLAEDIYLAAQAWRHRKD